ncbi:hypothetical protein Q9252_11195 [Marinobacter salarius]|uniref:hypothetical protein n=1 Tax=Marinobacter salarius TaxID=1420917 RepID=UPI00273B1B1E|nr:hypothetical protein [Marinobacter salarius]MDP4532709.1 hypothetical protein [Marinobacter salarius]
MSSTHDRTTRYQEGSLTLPGTVMLGTGVMIGAGIFHQNFQFQCFADVFLDGDRP